MTCWIWTRFTNTRSGIVIEFKSQTHRQRSNTPQCEGARFLDHRRKRLYSSFRFVPGTNWRRLRTISLALNACSAASSMTSCAIRS